MPQPASFSLLAAVDYSELSDLVLTQTLELARRYGNAEAHFLHVSSDVPKDLGTGTRRTELLFNWLGDRLKNIDPLPTTVQIVGHEAAGDPSHVILQTAGDLLTDFVVVGSRGRTGVERMLMGSVAESVMRHAACPVLVVRPKQHDDPAAQIEPPCPRCVEARFATHGASFWCEQHQEKHGRRHTYYDNQGQTWGASRLVL
jgi:nucleotide-binding universal stress UspA family protein